jgi:hypothetical protein
MEIKFATNIERAGEDSFTVHFSASVATENDAHTVQRFVEGAIKSAAGRQAVKKTPLILPKGYLRDFRR